MSVLSYVRLRCELAEGLDRYGRWIGTPEVAHGGSCESGTRSISTPRVRSGYASGPLDGDRRTLGWTLGTARGELARARGGWGVGVCGLQRRDPVCAAHRGGKRPSGA
jgi:hypothetical protein